MTLPIQVNIISTGARPEAGVTTLVRDIRSVINAKISPMEIIIKEKVSLEVLVFYLVYLSGLYSK